MNQEQNDTGLNLLLADVFASDEDDLELLVRYAEGSSSLTKAERASVEARLSADLSWGDRLRVLQNFDATAISFDEAEGSEVQVAGAHVESPVSDLDSYRTSRSVVWAALAAAAAVIVWLVVPSGPVINQDDPISEPASMASAAPGAKRISAEVYISGMEETTQDLAPVEHALLVIAEADVNANGASEVNEIEPPRADLGNDASVTALAETPASHAAPIEHEIVAPAYDGSSEVQLAMLSSITYQAPAGRALRSFLGDAVRGTGTSVSLEAWVPDHVAQSAVAQPTLYWGMQGNLPDAHQLGFVITAESEIEPLYEGVLEAPATSGLQSLDLHQLGVSLAKDKVYRWTVFARAPESDPSEDRITQGWVEYRLASASLAKAMDAAPVVERAKKYAAQGYWYDALSLLVGLTEREPGDAKVRETLSAFLSSAGIKRTNAF